MFAQGYCSAVRALIVAFLLLAVGCNPASNKQQRAQQLSFEVIDSLLGPIMEVPSAAKSFHPPVGFVPIPDSLFDILNEQFVAQLGADRQVDFVQFFFNEPHGAGLIVSTVRDLNLYTDTAIFMDSYRNSLIDMYGADHIQIGDYWVGDVFVKNYLITDSAQVRFHLTCLSDTGDALDLEYIVPGAVYPAVVKSLESSIGTLQPITKGP